MKKIVLPARESWEELCKRPLIPVADLGIVVNSILNQVKSEGDKAVRFYSSKFDGTPPGNLESNFRRVS